VKRYLVIPALLLVGALIGAAQAAPFLESEKMPPTKEGEFSTQPDSFYLKVDAQRLACNTLVVKSTLTVQASCDLESLPPGEYLLILVAVKTSNATESHAAPRKLIVSKKYGARTYQGLRLLNTSYQVVP
jgi:hypothetical protein